MRILLFLCVVLACAFSSHAGLLSSSTYSRAKYMLTERGYINTDLQNLITEKKGFYTYKGVNELRKLYNLCLKIRHSGADSILTLAKERGIPCPQPGMVWEKELIKIPIAGNSEQRACFARLQPGTEEEWLEYLRRFPAAAQRTDTQGISFFHKAISHGHERVVLSLLEGGIDIHQKDVAGNTALQVAVGHLQVDIVRMLLKSGADPHVRDGKWRTLGHFLVDAFYDPCKNDRCLQILKIMRLLRAAGVDFNRVESTQGHSPLASAVTRRNWLVARWLIELGASGLVADNKHLTPLDYLKVPELSTPWYHFDNGHLIQKSKPQDFNKEWVSAQLLAEQKQHQEQAGTAAVLVGKAGDTIVHEQARRGDIEPWNLAYKAGECGVIRAEAKTSNAYGLTPLAVAVLNGHLLAVQWLHFLGADLNAVDSQGLTILDIAAGELNKDIVLFLLEKGAQPSTRIISHIIANTDDTSQSLAAAHDILEFIRERFSDRWKIFLNRGDGANPPLHEAARKGYQHVALLASFGVSKFDQKDFLGKSAADWATQPDYTGDYSKVVTLLTHPSELARLQAHERELGHDQEEVSIGIPVHQTAAVHKTPRTVRFQN